MTTIAANMRFILIDKIVEIEAGRRIKAVKNVSLAEEYLADHFPTFPVLPGVLLVRASPFRLRRVLMREDFPTLDRPANAISGRTAGG